MKGKARKINIIYIDSIDLLEYLQNKIFSIKQLYNGLPKDAEIVGVNYDYKKMAWAISIYSDEFEEILLGDEVPEFGKNQKLRR
jgi:hypothetical protein